MITVSPRIKRPSQPVIYVTKGKDAFFPKCIAFGYPLPTVTWSRVFTSFPERRSFASDGNLTIVNTTTGDSGIYVCEAVNTIGRARLMTQLVVLTVPSFTVKPPEILTVNTGENVRLSESGRSGSREEGLLGYTSYPWRANLYTFPNKACLTVNTRNKQLALLEG